MPLALSERIGTAVATSRIMPRIRRLLKPTSLSFLLAGDFNNKNSAGRLGEAQGLMGPMGLMGSMVEIQSPVGALRSREQKIECSL